MPKDKPITYPAYLRLPELLGLQSPRSDPPEHDEMLFIVIHQVYELWFKQLLHETDRFGTMLLRGDLYHAIATVKRMRTIMKTLVGQLDILETMTPLSFSSFRDRLDTASGFQSAQFRELEFLLGYKRSEFRTVEVDPDADRSEVQRRYEEPTVVDSFYRFLANRGVAVPEALFARDVREPIGESTALQDGLYTVYLDQPDLVILCESMLDFDEGLQEWRYRHVKLVERTIGAKRGTGGSLGVEFLKRTLFRPLFPDLWAVRHRM